MMYGWMLKWLDYILYGWIVQGQGRDDVLID